jgi:hypothetical protein
MVAANAGRSGATVLTVRANAPGRYVVIDISKRMTKRSYKRILLVVGALALAFGVLAAGSVPAALAAEAYQIRLVATPVDYTAPSFIAPLGNQLAWTGISNKVSKMYVFDLVTGVNTYINPGPSGSYYNPAAEGTYVAFQGGNPDGYTDIYLYDSDAKTVTPISYDADVTGDRNDWNPRIQNGRVVWEKDTADPATGSGIYLYDIASHAVQKIIAGPEYRDPDIWGDYVVCVKSVATDAAPDATAIVLYNLTNGDTKVIAGDAADKDNEHPRIDEGKVVWSSGDLYNADTAGHWIDSYQIHLYDVAAGTEAEPLTSDLAGNINPSIGGDLVVWQTWTPSTIKGYRISTGDTSDISLHGDAVREPEVNGTRVAWWGSKGLYYAVPQGEAAVFPDVPSGHHYLTAIEGVASKGIMTGYGNGDFGPNDWLIHQQFAYMIDKAMGYEPVETDQYDFTDQPPIVHVPDLLYPYHYVAGAVLKGWMVPYADGTFRPLYRERGKEAAASAVEAAGEFLTQPPDDFAGTLTNDSALVTETLRTAEYNHLLDNIVGPDGTLASWDPDAPATRAEIAQLLWNLYLKVNPTT